MENNKEQVTAFARMMVDEVMKHLPMEVPESEKGKYEEVMLKIMTEDKSPREAMGFSEEMMEHIYAYGHRLYNNGNYKKAQEIFTSLIVFQPEDARFYLGLAACCQRLGEWDNAANAYNACSLIDTDSPMPLFYMYECLMQLKRHHDAAACLGEVVTRCGDLELFAPIKERCLLLLQNQKEAKKEEVKAGAGKKSGE